MDIAARKTVIECIYAGALTSALKAGSYDCVQGELERNLEFVQEHCPAAVRAVYERARQWLAPADPHVVCSNDTA